MGDHNVVEGFGEDLEQVDEVWEDFHYQQHHPLITAHGGTYVDVYPSEDPEHNIHHFHFPSSDTLECNDPDPRKYDDAELDLTNALKKYWGYQTFRPHQLELCKTLLEGRDAFFMTATGSGKSLLYQLPAVALRERGVKACSLVISPLLSLIEDQVSSLLLMGIPACALGSNSTIEIEQLAMQGHFTLIYSTPEKISTWTRGLRTLQQNALLLCCAIDESHCVSEWGFGFRPEYRSLGQLRDIFGSQVPIIALTASATKRIEEDIVHNLKLVEPVRIRTSVNRVNLKYIVKEKHSTNDVLRCLVENRKEQLKRFTSSNIDKLKLPYESSIIYVPSRKATSDLARDIVQCSFLPGIKVAYYHAGMTAQERAHVHNAFLRDEIQVIVATNAFGMGINKPDIRLIVHYGLPISIESYYQQTGRAGRDDAKGTCVLLWSRNDEATCRSLLDQNNQEIDVKYQIQCMKGYVRSDCVCRRKYLLDYFNEDTSPLHFTYPTGYCCDVCDGNLLQSSSSSSSSGTTAFLSLSTMQSIAAIDVSREVYMLLKTVFECKERFGLSVPIAILLGRNDQQVKRIPNYTELTFFGSGKLHSETWWKALVHQLEEYDGLLEKKWTQVSGSAYGYHRYTLSENAKVYLFGDATIYTSIQIFDPILHRIQLKYSKDFIKALEIEQSIRRSEEQNLAELRKLQRIRSSSNNSNGTTSDDPLRYRTFEDYVDSDEENGGISLEDQLRLKINSAIREKRNQISAKNGLNPYTVMTTQDIASLENMFSSLSSEIKVITPLQLMQQLNWPTWKMSFAEELANAITEVISTPIVSMPLSSNEKQSDKDKQNSSANELEIQSQLVVKTPSIYIPKYSQPTMEQTKVEEDDEDDITSFLADDEPTASFSRTTTIEKQPTEEALTSTTDPSSTDQIGIVGLKRTSSTEASNKACKRRVGGITGFKARSRVV